MTRARRFSALLLAALLAATLVTPASAAESERTVIDLGNGFYVVETIIPGPMTRAGDSTAGTKMATRYQGSTLIGTATLVAVFDISGSTAKATMASVSGTGSNGGAYSRGTTSCSGNTAYGTAYFTYSGVERNLTITLSCSPDGTLS